MATTVGSHSVSTFATPVNGGPLDANVVRGNDNTIRSAYVAHDADTGIHVQSSTLANRPAAGTAGRKWITADTGIFKLWYDDGTTWHEVGTSTIDVYVLADENLVKGDIVKVTGYNVGNGAPRVAKVSSAADVAFGIVNGTIAANAVGYVTNTGLIIDLNTNAFAIGDILYPNTSGGLTTTKPTSGNYQPAGFVLRSNSNNGVLYVEFSAPRIVERSDNTASTVVLRDASGNFAAGTITAGALTSTGLVTFASLKGTGSTTVTNIINDGTMATASATTLATSSSIKTYVDAQIGANNELSEVLVNGNTTGARDIIVTAGQKITTDTIAETTLNAGVTIDSVLLKDDVVNATDIEVDTISANNGTLAVTLGSTGVATIAQQPIVSSLTASQAVFTDSAKGLVSNAITGSGNVVMSASPTLTGTIAAASLSMSGTLTLGTDVALSRGAADRLDLATGDSFNVVSGSYKIANTDVLTSTTLGSGIVNSSLTSVGTLASLTVSGALVGNGNITLGSDTADSITVNGIFPTGTKLRTDNGVGNTLAVSAYDVDGTAYVDLITATASNTPTLALTSTGVGSMNNIAIGGSTPAAGAFTTLGSSGDFAVATNKFTVASATGNTAVAGTLTTEGTLTSNGNTVIGSAATDTITATAQFVTGTQLKSAQSANNTLALSAYDVDGTAYVDLVKLTAGNTPTLTLISTGVGSLDNITIGGSTAAAGSFTSLSASGNFTLGADVVLSRGAANRLDLASGDSLNVVSGDIQIGGSTVISSTSVGTLSSLTVSGDLTVDTNTLFVDSANNRVGINTTSPATRLDINTGASATAITLQAASDTGAQMWLGVGADGGSTPALVSTGNGLRISTTSASSMTLVTNSVDRAVIDSSGNFAVDTNTLYVDAANNRVGIGTATPSAVLDVVGSGAATVIRDTQAYSPSTSGGALSLQGLDSGGTNIQLAALVGRPNNGNPDRGFLNIFTRINGINTSTLQVGTGLTGDVSVPNGNFAVDTNTLYVDAANNQVGMGRTPSGYTLDITTGGNAIRMERSGVEMGGFISGSLPYWGTLTNHDFLLMTNGTVKARLDASGNFGLGVTPSAWDTAIFRTVQVGSGVGSVSLSGRTDNGKDMVLGSNLYYSTGNFRYVGAGVATIYRMDGGSHSWSTAPSGTAGDAISFTQAMTLDASGRLQLNTTTAYTRVTIKGSAGVGNGYGILGATANTGCYFGAISATADDDFEIWNERTGYLRFGTANTERARITSGGTLLVGKTDTSIGVVGHRFDADGTAQHVVDGNVVLFINRKTSDGGLVNFYQDAALEGDISVSGNTVSYNAFAGSHWSQLEDGSKPEILRGTVMEAINELCEWPGEQNERLPKAKVSDTAGSKKVYGVFMDWDNDWTVTNDMYVTAVGAFICRVAADVVVEQGDLLESNGDGTARVQADDVIRSSTIGKVTSTVKTHEYEDGTYCVPTVLYCG